MSESIEIDVQPQGEPAPLVANPPEMLVFGMSGGFLGCIINMLVDPQGSNIGALRKTQLVMSPSQETLNSRVVSTLIQEFGFSQADAATLVPSAMVPLVSGGQYLPLDGSQPMTGPLAVANDGSVTMADSGSGKKLGIFIDPGYLAFGSVNAAGTVVIDEWAWFDASSGSFVLTKGVTVTDGGLDIQRVGLDIEAGGARVGGEILQSNGNVTLGHQPTDRLLFFAATSGVGTPALIQTVAGAWAGNTAGKALSSALANYGLIKDTTTA